MSFFVVPSVSYQTQQKLKSHKEKKKAKEKKKEVEKELKREERRHDSDAASIMSKGKKTKPGWGLLHRTSTSSKASSTDMRNDSDYNDDAKSVHSSYTTNPPNVASDREGVTSDADDWESLYSDQVSKSRSYTNLTKARSEEPETRRFNLDEVLSEGQSSHRDSKHSFDRKSQSSEQISDLDSPSSSSTDMGQSSSVLSNTNRRSLPEEAEIEEDKSSLIANSYGRSVKSDTFKPLGSHNRQTSVVPKQTQSRAISPLTPIVHSATFHSSTTPSAPGPRPRTNSAFTTTSAPSGHSQQRYPSNAAFHRNSSSSSSNTTQSQPAIGSKESSSKFRKLHFLTSNTKKKGGGSTSLPSSPGANSPRQSPGSNQPTDSYFPEMTNQPASTSIPSFHVITDLSVCNSFDTIKENFLSPQYQLFRYKNFQSLMSEYHSSDAIHFAKIRNQSLLKFIVRHKRARAVVDERGYFDQKNYRDLDSTECILAYFLFDEMRSDMRMFIKAASKNHPLANHEELIQANYVNYVRYLIQLPEVSNVDILSEDVKRHYENKQVFDIIGNSLYSLKHDVSSDVSNESNRAIKARLLLECVIKVSYEYFLLEKYRFDMISKYHANHLVPKRHLENLFGIYRTNVTLRNKECPKVLLFNAINSAQYGWYHATTAPFVRFVETSVYEEDMGVLQDYNVYQKLEQASIKTDFAQSDNELYNSSVSKLNLSSYQEYNSKSMDSLVALTKEPDNNTNEGKISHPEGAAEFATTVNHKPRNFEYYNHSLATIPSNSFNLIQTGDLPYQVKRENYKTILREFHRILKPGGSFISDSIHFGSKSTHVFLHEHVKGNFPRAWNYIDFSVSQHFEVIPNFVETILIELNSIFGKGNVRFGITLLSSSSEVNYFLAKFGGLKLFEMIGKLGEYCDYFDDDETVRSQNELSVHFQVHIEAIKRA
ncbi:hypothetical protein KGF57_000901 [Candida theae]|uniref:Uncharacterized protein n=1 Tax=Candida theae TaxID=1198502 RepID=A0AAD5BI80_9ASCO|nr:uncharacterized protein KGF57_000901 [Candida theae]KAI5965108.1 hypothetical protein KGF57_000901 [Candida theae]